MLQRHRCRGQQAQDRSPAHSGMLFVGKPADVWAGGICDKIYVDLLSFKSSGDGLPSSDIDGTCPSVRFVSWHVRIAFALRQNDDTELLHYRSRSG